MGRNASGRNWYLCLLKHLALFWVSFDMLCWREYRIEAASIYACMCMCVRAVVSSLSRNLFGFLRNGPKVFANGALASFLPRNLCAAFRFRFRFPCRQNLASRHWMRNTHTHTLSVCAWVNGFVSVWPSFAAIAKYQFEFGWSQQIIL